MDNLDELQAYPERVMRLIVDRRVSSTASRGFRFLAKECRNRQRADPRRHLLLGAEAVCFGGLAWAFLKAARWGGYRTRYQHPQKKRPHPILPISGRQDHGLRAVFAVAAGRVRQWV
ncbi:MAG TPA: hypothetical protein VH482_04560 [Thermomicrobiales bacterium]|jgi:hypothetical protein